MSTTERDGPARRHLVVLCCVAAAPILWSVASLWDEWHPVGDVAVVGLRAHDVVSADPPLVGMPTTLSRAVGEQVYHPGPLEFWVLALPVRLSGGSRLAPMLTIAALNAAAVASTVVLVHRAAGRLAAVGATAGALVLLTSLRGELLVDPYNPHAAVLPVLVAVVALAVDLADVEGRWALPLAALAASLAAQAHLASAAAIAGAVLAWLVAAIVTRRGRRSVAAAAVVLVLCWAPAAASPGNLLTLAGGPGGDEPRIGLDGGLSLAANALAPPAVWMSTRSGADEALDHPSALRAAAAIAVAATAVGLGAVLHRRGQPLVLTAAAVALGALVVGAAAAGAIPTANALGTHSFVWSWAVGATVWTAAAAGLGALLWPRAAVIALVAAVVVAVASPPRIIAQRRTMEATAEVAAQLRRRLEPGIYRVGLGAGALDAKSAAFGLMYALERSPIDLRTGSADGPSVTDLRTVDDDADVPTLVVAVAAARTPPAGRLVAEFRPASDHVTRLRRTERVVLEAVERAGGVRLDTGQRWTGEEAVELVRSGGLVVYARLGVVAEPELDGGIIDRLEAAQATPAYPLRVFLVPSG